ncbi:Germinal-center associated nuclear protein [Galdieria sulphuraria]|uniref:SAC3/GANP/THP3 conserved domain-containing protein n=1 Tax=Galdieria sulphuraria TaxID=130081 RepID=M2XLS4_GALSU|nr:uncharacterized protein Gasu_16380 [Galdieria sulphuraria]EME31142.1 hypothetical protein Gasu_16380 [Galdieria sulphuraria]GJD12389.1 Germinal-center associated nuclear protein [Galdieria sulphuraria]|eukprot:XP_005707662.1 hypothetical protein Gasu_16380 [Galdieria sulphuraria]
MHEWIPNLTWGQYEQTESGNKASLWFQNNSSHTVSELNYSFEGPFPSSVGQPILNDPSAQPSLQLFGSVPLKEAQTVKHTTNFSSETRKIFEEQPQYIVQPKDPFATSRKESGQTTPFALKPREYPVQQRKTAQLLLSRCSSEFCQYDIVKQYFESILPGKVVQVQVKPERGSAIVSFSTEDDAEIALKAGTPQGEYRMRMRYFIPKDYRRRDYFAYRDPYFSAEASGNEEEVVSSKMDTEDLPAFETPLPSCSDNVEQSRAWKPFGYNKESLMEAKVANEDEIVRKLKRESRFIQNVVSDDEGEVEHVDDTGWRTAGEKQQLSLAHNLIGTCLEMCPAEERTRRELQRDLSIFEIDYCKPTVEGEPPKVDHLKAVKKYVRSAACQEAPKPNEIRPPYILEKTMEYLMEYIVDRKDCSFSEVHNFVRDRTRSIRQDFTFQGVRNEMTIDIIEKTVRFHILSEQRLCEEDSSVYSSRQNMEQLDKCLISLREMYRERRAKGLTTSVNEGEFQAYYVLSHFDPHSILAVCRELDIHVLKSRQVEFALKVYQTLRSNNYVGFFRLLQRASYLVACMMQQHFSFVRKSALLIMQKCYSRFPVMPIAELEEMLAFEDLEDTLSFCESLGFVSDYLEDGIRVIRLDNTASADELTKYHPRRSLKHIEPKSNGFSVKDIMMGKTEILDHGTSSKKHRDLLHVREARNTQPLPRIQQENYALKDNERRPTRKLSANALEFIPHNQQQMEQTNFIAMQMNVPCRYIKEELNRNKSNSWSDKCVMGRADTLPSNQRRLEGPPPGTSSLSPEFSTKDDIPFTGQRNTADMTQSSLSSELRLDKEDENIPKIDYFHCKDSSPKIPGRYLKRKNLFWSDEGVRRENEFLGEGKKSKIVEEQSEWNAALVNHSIVEKSKNSENIIERDTEEVRSDNELWIASQRSQGSRLLKFLPQIRELQLRYRNLASKSVVDTEKTKELSTLIEKIEEIRRQLFQFLLQVNATDICNDDKELRNIVFSIREFYENLEVFISDMLSIKCQWQCELRKLNDAARSLIRAPAEAVSNYSSNEDRAVFAQNSKTPINMYRVRGHPLKIQSTDVKEVRHTTCLITVKKLVSQEEQEVVAQGLKMLSMGITSEKESSSHFMVPLVDCYCEVWTMDSDTAFVEGVYTMAKPNILVTGVNDVFTIDWKLWKRELKSFILKNFSIAVTMLVFVHSNQQYCRESIDLGKLVDDELSDLQKDGFISSVSIVRTDRRYAHEYFQKLADIWETIINDAERGFQVAKYLWIYPSISTGYYTALEVAMSCVRLAFDQLFVCNYSFETLCAENFGWIANKLSSISNLCLQDCKYRENFVIATKAFQKLCWNARHIFTKLGQTQLSNEELILLIMDHGSNWWQDVEDMLESSLGSISVISLPIRLDRLLKDKEESGSFLLSDSCVIPVRRKNRGVDISLRSLSVSNTSSSTEPYEEVPEWLQSDKQHLSELEERMRVSTIQDKAVLLALIDTKQHWL